jgi:hypothetical protein
VPNKRIKKSDTHQDSASRIKLTKTNPPQGVSFSYKYFQSDHSDFTITAQDISYLIALLERLRDVSGWTSLDLKKNGSKALRCHSIDWVGTSQSCFGIPNEDQLVDEPYQFSISANKHGRVHGFFIGEVFYVVWLDPDHKLYSSK